jgi:glutathione synthase/RimK-type ligase-like ATP-grasp enzyme
MTKIEEYRRFKAAGLPVPEAVMLEPSTKLDPASWGPFTILKPIWASGGQGVTLVRTQDVQWVDPLSWPKDDSRHGLPLLAQKFIDTGPYSAKYRVLAMFGRVLYCERQPSLEPGPALDPNGTGPIEGFIASAADQRANELNYDADVLAFAPSTAKAFPEVPVLAIDLIREQKTGKLYVLEVNPGGNAWHLSSPIGKQVQKQHNIDRYKQFDALAVVADALIEKTRAEAE